MTLEVFFIEKRPLYSQERLRWKVQDHTETVESIVKSSNFEFDTAEITNVPIAASSSENEIMNCIIKNLPVDNDKYYIKQKDGSNTFTLWVDQNQQEKD